MPKVQPCNVPPLYAKYVFKLTRQPEKAAAAHAPRPCMEEVGMLVQCIAAHGMDHTPCPSEYAAAEKCMRDKGHVRSRARACRAWGLGGRRGRRYWASGGLSALGRTQTKQANVRTANKLLRQQLFRGVMIAHGKFDEKTKGW